MGALVYTYTHPRFAWTRSYLTRIEVYSDYTVDPVLSSNVIQWTSAAGYIYSVVIKPEVLEWSSNAYTDDHLFDEAGSSIDCVLFPCFDLLTVSHIIDVNDARLALTVHPAATGSVRRVIDLPSAPPDYWLPPDP